MNNLVIVFPGQGSQYTGMGRTWFDTHESVRARFTQASEIVGYSLEELCFSAAPTELTKTRHAQVALLVLGYSMHEVLSAQRKLPVAAMAGHSLGEITALASAGALSFEDAVRLVRVRGEAMEVCATENRTGMIAVRMPVAEVEKHADEFNGESRDVQIANYNAEEQTVLSGTLDDLQAMTSYLEDRGHRVIRLNVAGAFHSTYMAGAVPAYVKAIGEIDFSAPRVPVYSTITGAVYGSAQEIPDALALQLTSPVRWSSVVSSLATQDVSLWLESGPKKVLAKLIGGVVGSDAVYSLDEDTDEAYAAVDRLIEAKKAEPGLAGLCMGAAAATRNRNFDDTEYTAGVLTPYRGLQELNRMDKDELTEEQKRSAVEMLLTIMRTKRVPEAEQSDRIASILRRTGDAALEPTAGGSTA
ncbi:ACP S-malonyltransferase [Streptomyces sp. NPDC017520]|uniref:ACP S-malonyltransferase n=1 Tax=Streptomyces sp. NPDC017520 TaxID=3364998 RepID=UPI0037B0B4F7